MVLMVRIIIMCGVCILHTLWGVKKENHRALRGMKTVIMWNFNPITGDVVPALKMMVENDFGHR